VASAWWRAHWSARKNSVTTTTTTTTTTTWQCRYGASAHFRHPRTGTGDRQVHRLGGTGTGTLSTHARTRPNSHRGFGYVEFALGRRPAVANSGAARWETVFFSRSFSVMRSSFRLTSGVCWVRARWSDKSGLGWPALD